MEPNSMLRRGLAREELEGVLLRYSDDRGLGSFGSEAGEDGVVSTTTAGGGDEAAESVDCSTVLTADGSVEGECESAKASFGVEL